jgi:hypothetical protein
MLLNLLMAVARSFSWACHWVSTGLVGKRDGNHCDAEVVSGLAGGQLALGSIYFDPCTTIIYCSAIIQGKYSNLTGIDL